MLRVSLCLSASLVRGSWIKETLAIEGDKTRRIMRESLMTALG